jgi:hypothetical protein
MTHIIEDREGLADDLMGLMAFDVDYEANSAGIVLATRIVKALFGRQSGGHQPVYVVLTHHPASNKN